MAGSNPVASQSEEEGANLRNIVQEVDYGFGDITYIIKALGRLSTSTFELIRELVDNSFDSIWGSEAQRASYHIVIKIDRLNNRICISDDAHGMSYSRLVQIPSEIGAHKDGKRLNAVAAGHDLSRTGTLARTRGLHQFGLHGWLAVSHFCLVTSRYNGSDETFSLLMGLDEDDRLKRPNIAQESVSKPYPGTDVELSGITAARMDRVSIKRLVDFLAQEYRVDLSSTNPQITIEIIEFDRRGQKRDSVYVSPVVVKGDMFTLAKSVEQKFVTFSNGREPKNVTPIRFSITGLKGRTDGRLRVRWGPRRVYDNVTEIEGFNRPPWNTGRLDGEIYADFCIPDPGKKAFIEDDDNRFAAFQHGLREMEEELSDFVATLEPVSKQSTDTLLKKDCNFVLDAFSELGFELDGFPVAKKRSAGGTEEINVKLRKQPEQAVGNQQVNGLTGKGSQIPTVISSSGEPAVDQNKPKANARRHPQFDFQYWMLDDVPDRIIPKVDENGRLFTVIINMAHPDYKALVEPNPSSNEAKRYRMDQLIVALLAHYHGSDGLPATEFVAQVDDLRYRVYQNANLTISK